MSMKKWHWGGFVGCVVGGVALFLGTYYVVAVLLSIVGARGTVEAVTSIAIIVFFLIVTTALVVGLICQGSRIDELHTRLKKLEEEKKEEK